MEPAVSARPAETPRTGRALPLGVALALGCAGAFAGFAAGTGLTGSWRAGLAAGLLAFALSAAGGWRFARWLDPSAVSRPLVVVSLLATAAALIAYGRLTVFMVDPSQVRMSSLPSSSWELRHSCLTAYYVAAEKVKSVPSVYDPSLYNAPDDDPRAPRKPRMLGPFGIDVFEYPPPFLLLPRALLVATPDFLRLRALWHGLNLAVVLLAVLLTARALGPPAGTRALLLAPLLFASLPALSTFQKGNVQALTLAISMLAMLLFEAGRTAAGAPLLAFAGASKLYPGVLVFNLLARRRFAAVVATVLFGLALCVASFLDVGWAPYQAFLSHLSGLLSGEAFPAFRNPKGIAINLSVPGLVFKLGLFGVPGMGFPLAKVVGTLYMLAVTAATYVLSRRPLPRHEAPLLFLAILIAATLRSPFLPQGYGSFPALWLLTLLGALQPASGKTLALTLLAWTGLNLNWPLDWPIDARRLAALNTLPQGITMLLPALVARRVLRR